MGSLCFYLAVVSACLLWSAAFTAAAARTQPGVIRRLLVMVAVALPVASLLPWVFVTGLLAFWMRLETNWFTPTLTAAISAAVGGGWIAWMGLAPRVAPVAATWPLVRLAAMFVIAKMVIGGTLLIIDNAVKAEARQARAEAVAIMQSVVPPTLPPDADAAPLYQQAFDLMATDKELTADDSPLTHIDTVDISAAAVTDILARHAATLDLLRQAADRPACRFVRDWSRPSVDMLLPELSPLRQGARMLALAARREAADGDLRAAITDVVRLHRIATHIAAEPLLISGLVGIAIDGIAIDTLTVVLPSATPDDAAALDGKTLGNLIRGTISLQRHLLGEEAFGLSLFASLAEGDPCFPDIETVAAATGSGFARGASFLPLTILFRSFLLPADIQAYRSTMKRFQRLFDQGPTPSCTASLRGAEAIEADLAERRRGMLTAMIFPALSGVLETQAKSLARHRAAEVVLAATRARLTRGELPESAESLVPEFMMALPRDPFLDDGPLIVKIGDDGWVVYSVGPNGKDDGGPPPSGNKRENATGPSNDDIGLWLER
jgi:hypothetical protein